VLIPQVTALQTEQQKDLQELVIAQLMRRKERLAEYSTQARFAVAQLYDRASLSSNSADHAPAKP
jgi:conjugal transfer/entry exclusion protein